MAFIVNGDICIHGTYTLGIDEREWTLGLSEQGLECLQQM